MTAFRLLPVLLACLSACGGRDPILDRAEALDDPTAAEPGAHAEADPGSPARVQATPPPPGRPEAPTPAPPGAPEEGVPGTPRPGTAEPPPPPGATGGVLLSGTVVLDDHTGGTIRVDVFDGDQRAASGGGKRPGVVAMARLDAPGPFEVRVPDGTTQVWLGAFADEDRDGRPGPLDPEVWFEGNPVTLTSDTTGLTLQLERRAPPPGD